MFHVHDGYRKTFRIPARSFNNLAKFCNYHCAGFGIDIKRPDEPSSANPVTFSLNTKDLASAGYVPIPQRGTEETDAAYSARTEMGEIEFVEDVENETATDKVARIGTSRFAAPLDHGHALPFWINPEYGETGNVQPEDVYVPKAGEDISGVDFSGSSPYAARADHTHVFATEGATVEDLVVYQLYRPTGQYNYYGLPITMQFVNGLLTSATAGTAVNLNDLSAPNEPTIS